MKKIVIVLCTMLLFFLCGCKNNEPPEGSSSYMIYYVGSEQTKIVSEEYFTATTDAEELFEEFYKELSKVQEKLEYIPPFGGLVVLKEWNIKNGRLLLNFTEEYNSLSSEAEVLTRAAIVKTFIQIPAINYVTFQVEGEDLEDNLGKIVGAMYEDSFIYNEGAQINSFEELTLQLYFANEAGDALVKTDRTIMYNTNVAMERVILEQLIEGPNTKKVYATLNPNTKILSVVIKDKVCYVNFNSAFLTQVYSVSPEVVIYSVVNSLCEMNSIDKVQISVDGDNSILFRETMQLGVTYEQNLEMNGTGLTN